MHEAAHLVDTPLGRYLLRAEPEGLVRLQPADAVRNAPPQAIDRRSRAHLDATAAALREYFAGERRAFDDLRLAPRGSGFPLRVWQALRAIPFGETCSYGELARALGHPDAARAVGVANARNPIALIVPCHRVIGADGSLTGYAGGLWRKRWLLDHEQATAGRAQRGEAERRPENRPGPQLSFL